MKPDKLEAARDRLEIARGSLADAEYRADRSEVIRARLAIIDSTAALKALLRAAGLDENATQSPRYYIA